MEEHCYGRGQDCADAYVAAIIEYSGWKVKLRWVNKNDAKVPLKSKPKKAMPMEYTPIPRDEDGKLL